ncbi:MAG TPA: hypothetical protein VFG08_01555 [Candidatus Polarisedimenticolia bacterium]|nr:hypothetical protein [Candidatus Polarisedimenticolia bacterium]
MKRSPLVQTLKSIIERSYGLPEVIGDVAPFIVGDRGYSTLYGSGPASGTEAGAGARVMVRRDGEQLRAALYYPDALVRHLERFNPLLGIGDENIDAFATLVEELDHLVLLAGRAAAGRPASLLELEYHAGVTKYLMVLHFLSRQTRRWKLSEPYRRWARHHLFEKYAGGRDDDAVRYRDAALLARRYVLYLEGLSVPQRVAELRELEQRSFADTRSLIARIS